MRPLTCWWAQVGKKCGIILIITFSLRVPIVASAQPTSNEEYAAARALYEQSHNWYLRDIENLRHATVDLKSFNDDLLIVCRDVNVDAGIAKLPGMEPLENLVAAQRSQLEQTVSLHIERSDRFRKVGGVTPDETELRNSGSDAILQSRSCDEQTKKTKEALRTVPGENPFQRYERRRRGLLYTKVETTNEFSISPTRDDIDRTADIKIPPGCLCYNYYAIEPNCGGNYGSELTYVRDLNVLRVKYWVKSPPLFEGRSWIGFKVRYSTKQLLPHEQVPPATTIKTTPVENSTPNAQDITIALLASGNACDVNYQYWQPDKGTIAEFSFAKAEGGISFCKTEKIGNRLRVRFDTVPGTPCGTRFTGVVHIDVSIR